MNRLARLLGASALGLSAALSAGAIADDGALVPIPSLDVSRYVGRWYEIAKFPNRFQRKCVGDTTAQYSLLSDGSLQVVNRCRVEDGRYEEAVGAARQIGGRSSPKLEVRFAPAWLSFIPAVWGDYWVIDLDADYHTVAVSEPEREYLWILSRSPQVSPEVYADLLQRLRDQGFDTRRLGVTTHSAEN